MTTDRLWTRPATLSADERSLARLTVERDPSLLDGPVLAALACCEDGTRYADLMLETIRGVKPCAT
jgi:hypothetical protein